jgi:meso-butanediol dehydrogenase / (S,S)-butanediol dehydrogenase / diacetyl reductase
MRLRDRVAIVTGAASGIGQAIAMRAAREGASVVVADIAAEHGQATVAEIEQMGSQAMFVEADVASAQDTQRAVAATLAAYGRIDVLVNNAAIGGGDDILDTDEATWDRVVAVVLKSVYLCSRAALPSMLEQRRGAIVNISSVNGLYGLGEEAYSAAKAGVINLTQNLAIRYAERGVRVNVICPGTVRTPIWQTRVDRAPDIFDRLQAWYPVGRVGEPDDIAAAAVFLASDEASFINGAVLPVDGGLTAGLYRLSRELEGQ